MNSELLQRVVFAWEPLLSESALWVAAVVAVLVLGLGWRGTAGIATRKRLGLLGLRALALSIFAVILAGPARVTTEDRVVREPLAVLIDSSRSMRVKDVDEQSRAAAVGEWMKRQGDAFDTLRNEYDLRFFLFDDRLEAWGSGAPAGDGASDEDGDGRPDFAASAGGGPGSGDPSPATGSGTDIGGALFGLREALGGRRPAGALVVSDGADRAALGRAAVDPELRDARIAELLGGLGFPVSTFAIGDETGPADLAIRSVEAPPFGFVRRPLTISVDVERRAMSPGVVPVTLFRDDEVVGSVEVSSVPGETVTAEFLVKPDRVGYHTYKAVVPTPAGDTVPSNNTMERTIKVVRDRTRVLQVTSRPAWDVKFLRRLLKTDPNIDLVSFFILRTNTWRGPLTNGSERLSLIAFPYDDLFTTDLQGFDLVVFQNFSLSSFSDRDATKYLQSIADYVRAGGAFLMVGGDSSLGEVAYGETALTDILPTSVPTRPATATTFGPVLTPTGERHPITRLARDAAENVVRWQALPKLQGWNPLGPLQEGAVGLVRAGPKETDPLVVAARTVGKGRSFVVATDTTWRWALGGTGGPGAGEDHAEFWRNAVRWLVKDVEQKQVQVLTDRENYRLGEPIRVQVQVLGEDYAPRAGAKVVGTLNRPGGKPTVFQGETDKSGQMAASVSGDVEGTHVISVDVAAIDDPFGTAEVRVSVSDREGELEEPAVRPALLAAVAAATEGDVLDGPNPDPRTMARRDEDVEGALDRTVKPLWASPWLLGLLMLPLGIEWVLRRRMGLR